MIMGLEEFVAESNAIEGFRRPPTSVEVEAHVRLLAQRAVRVEDVERFVAAVAGVPLRHSLGMDVRVGPHLPPPGGEGVERALRGLLESVNYGDVSPFEAHVEYEKLHPFMDGNGRSGRALWAWHMRRDGLDPFALPFLHRWYYQSLEASR